MTKKHSEPATITKLAKVQPLEILGLFFALFFMHSVATSAHHILLARTAEARQAGEVPAILLLALGMLIVGYYANQRKKLSTISIVILTIFGVSIYLWGIGLRANI